MAILKDEGIDGLYKGMGSKLVQSVLTAAILFAGQRRIFEISKAVSFRPALHILTVVLMVTTFRDSLSGLS